MLKVKTWVLLTVHDKSMGKGMKEEIVCKQNLKKVARLENKSTSYPQSLQLTKLRNNFKQRLNQRGEYKPLCMTSGIFKVEPNRLSQKDKELLSILKALSYNMLKQK